MSFLNPVNEPVLRFSSTDPGAPQINYNARVAGDVKTVIKACLAIGYGTKPSAGWSIINEVGNVAEFVSPSAAMSDYRLGIDDTSASSTTWYYQYQDVRTNPGLNAPSKSFSGIATTHASNGWQLLVTERGIIFIELVYATGVSNLSSRMTYFGKIKDALVANTGQDIAFFNVGHAGTIAEARNLYIGQPYVKIAGQLNILLRDAVTFTVYSEYKLGLSALDLTSRIYIISGEALIGQMPALWSQVTNNAADMYGAHDVVLDGRNKMRVTLGHNTTNAQYLNERGRVMLIDLDSWEY